MRRLILLLAVVAATLVVAGGVALAANSIGTDGPDTLRGTDEDDKLVGKGGNDVLFSLNGRDKLLGGPGKDCLLCVTRRHRSLADDKILVGGTGNTICFGPARVPTAWRAGKATTFLLTTPCANPRRTTSSEGRATT